MAEVKELTSITDRVTADGSSGYKAEKGRYHLYISHVCPFAHRTMIARELKGLQDVVSVDNVNPVMNNIEMGWEFDSEKEGCGPDTVNGKKFLREIYENSHPEYKGRITVPVLFDKHTKRIVNNESAEILRMLSTEFNEFCPSQEQKELNFYPEELRKEIDDIVNYLNQNIIYTVYKAARVESQSDYEEAVQTLFNGLDKLNSILSTKRFLLGSQLTEADIKLFVVLVRFDIIYYMKFMCSKRMICSYEHLWPYVRDIYQMGTLSDTVKISQIKEGYWKDKRTPKQLDWIPVGPDLDFNEKPGRI